MELILCYGKLLEQDYLRKYNVSEKSDDEDLSEARYNYLCEVLGNSSLFEEDSTRQEDEKYMYLFPRKHFVSKYGRIVTGIVMPCGWPDISDNTDETYIISNSAEELIDLVVKAFGEYYGLEIHSKISSGIKKYFFCWQTPAKKLINSMIGLKELF